MDAEKEIDVLKALANMDDPSQRDIEKHTDMSLGTINAVIKKCVSKGLIKIEGASGASMKYILTPRGIKKLTARTLNYIQSSYRAIKKLRQTVKNRAQKDAEAGRSIYLYGAEDEVGELVETTLAELGLEYEVKEELKEIPDRGTVVYYWNPELREEIETEELTACNVLKLSDI
ncbi:MarR family transcriptional regulator [Halarsenatibacter silvermanii]|uniref:Winged helix-turn-helix DNA-binding n=1 Tax=Halarsenatibacter silvermanii TaxID=321763 RepID=A0A1G9SDC6_9FIRM|nr:MarR family transcriptional regulator [Halarsenatibacter silvermanii]SDM32795.1 Winged helix-turn-helix DNA-binding [Halarsenatibacter silvermanii]